jgi:mannose/fructose/N-acetylgalactosamine-specific phosphotransferase system component IID
VKLELQDLALVAEIIGGFTVVASLLAPMIDVTGKSEVAQGNWKNRANVTDSFRQYIDSALDN